MFLRALTGAVIGALGGALAGALAFGLDARFDVGSSFIGPTNEWWPLHAMAGGLGGGVLGLVFGLSATFTRLGRIGNIVVGCVIGCLGATSLLFMNVDRLSWQQRSLPAQIAPLVLSILCWSL